MGEKKTFIWGMINLPPKKFCKFLSKKFAFSKTLFTFDKQTPLNKHTMNTQIYVGTYAKYNNGSLDGGWLDIADYSSSEEIIEAMKAVHEDEEDPEYMIQDMEEHAEALGVQESMSLEEWEEVYEALEALEASHLDIDVVQAYCKNTGEPINSDSIREAEEAYQGTYDSNEDFAQEIAEQIGAVNHGASWPNNCIDWEWAARELMYDYFEMDGHYFRNL